MAGSKFKLSFVCSTKNSVTESAREREREAFRGSTFEDFKRHMFRLKDEFEVVRWG